MNRQNPTEQADNLQNKGPGPCRLRGLPAIYRVLYQTQGWGETLLFGGKHCPLWGVGASCLSPISGHGQCLQVAACAVGAPVAVSMD